MKNCLAYGKGNPFNLAIKNHHFIKNKQISALEYKEPSSQVHFGNLFQKHNFERNTIYLLLRLATVDTVIRVFQYKVLHKSLFKKFFFSIKSPHLCVHFVVKKMKLPHTFFIHVIWLLYHGKKLQGVFQIHFSSRFNIAGCDPWLLRSELSALLYHHVILIFKFYIYKAGESKKNYNVFLKTR